MNIRVQELKQKLEAGENFVLLDIREFHEHEEFNLGGKLIPLATLMDAIPNLEAHKEEEIVVYCRSGQRSGVAQQLLQRAGFTNVRNLEGGVIAWATVFGVE